MYYDTVWPTILYFDMEQYSTVLYNKEQHFTINNDENYNKIKESLKPCIRLLILVPYVFHSFY